MAVEREYARRIEDVLYVSSRLGYEGPLNTATNALLAREISAVLAEM